MSARSVMGFLGLAMGAVAAFSGRGSIQHRAQFSATRAGPTVCAIASVTNSGSCSECLSNGNNGYIKCTNTPENFYCPTECYFSSGIPTCTLGAALNCNGGTLVFLAGDSNCSGSSTSGPNCLRTYIPGGTTWGPPEQQPKTCKAYCN